MILILLIVLLVLAVSAAPGFGPIPHDYNWGPSGLLGVLVIILLVLLLTGRL